MDAIVAIPARLKSTRFPNKILADIHGKPLIWYVYQQVISSQLIKEAWILTDSEEIARATRPWCVNTLMTSDQCPSGTARIASVIDKLEADIVVNVQGDEPLITPSVIDAMVIGLQNSTADVVTPVYRINSMEEVLDPNINKVTRANDGTALYFSRSPIPFVRDVDRTDWLSEVNFWGHVGVYGFRRHVLETYSQLPEGQLEKAEKLEQLRLLESGLQIMTVEIGYRPRGVDVPSDLDYVSGRLDPTQY